jgi:hypothetical protein
MPINAGANESSVRVKWERALQHWRGIQQQWARLRDPNFARFVAKRSALVARIEEEYGLSSEEAAGLVDNWLVSLAQSRDWGEHPLAGVHRSPQPRATESASSAAEPSRHVEK